MCAILTPNRSAFALMQIRNHFRLPGQHSKGPKACFEAVIIAWPAATGSQASIAHGTVCGGDVGCVVSVAPRVAYTNPAVLPRLPEADEVSQEALWLLVLHG